MIEQNKASIRFMIKDDIEKIVEVEQNAFTTPWTHEVFEQELEVNKFAHYLVYEKDEKIVGYCGVWIITEEAQVTNIAVHSDFRGHGYGEELLDYALSYSKLMGANRISLEVRLSNIVAQNLYKKLGFQPGGIRKNYYADNQEDALVMWVKL
ncbi:alanine acetyltransferase [Alkalihalobacillus alcalophilus ATCC 27647 = CGMCC 1.3604]|uniref:[Ribosomal protein bS18]-alanine N-acetyltransferase n=1 Tax=Alkalihalobacillus alcalophilus ATCC 27647 = CGMCC 1.3604 TaxID=1218173 RepID=A0A094WLS6_ALKAL|nr:ribosomal protein S18-alanine N-acetyltransferase [Alkalihalobacillus alcalophilus]KGA97776.1 alanine acetyltransferase [Alkalihalobacillus alcalophilus ATCC 27647 = CGMCC 1.3604]MED1562461.1 ribosomal protein S18-alanine N-acetyltransferase [Alkalihalobacillus alcalophilus]THG90758.1 alanine acetyltransferase [Alkalihalobacillus alcalophilus ATCC 27647 = CGMCC 1.3604]